MNKTTIKIENLSKSYRLFDKPSDRLKEALHPFGKKYSKDFFALDNVSFEVKKGECIGLLGKNGAGKSTLLKLLTGVLTPSNGNIRVDGKISALLELGGSFNPELTGMQNIYLNGTLMGFTNEEIDKKVADIVSFADIGNFINQPVKMYSSGMFARLAFAVSVNVEPDILIIDEVLAVGDLRFQIKCMDKMKELMSGGTTVLFVSHDINAIRRLCNRAIWFDKGKLIMDGDVNTVGDSYVDFIKGIDINDKQDQKLGEKETFSNLTGKSMGEILGVRVLNANNNEQDLFAYNEELKVEITYEIYDESLINVVIGVALFDINDTYICGLNTLLDKKEIRCKKGINRFSICYPKGLLVLGGRYYFDVAIEDKTATLPIHYIKVAKEITVESPYVSEGIFTIPHKWMEEL